MIHNYKMSYAQYLDKIQARGSPKAKAQLREILRRDHVSSEWSVAALFVIAIVGCVAGLGISSMAAGLLAVVILCADIYDRIRERRAGL
ncbi:MAG TPA: hypothetical protein VFW00_05940 [Rhodocyclaceae bacterium]|nr:hypothetical protein [Rhodocyclaceae bacterium]